MDVSGLDLLLGFALFAGVKDISLFGLGGFNGLSAVPAVLLLAGITASVALDGVLLTVELFISKSVVGLFRFGDLFAALFADLPMILGVGLPLAAFFGVGTGLVGLVAGYLSINEQT